MRITCCHSLYHSLSPLSLALPLETVRCTAPCHSQATLLKSHFAMGVFHSLSFVVLHRSLSFASNFIEITLRHGCFSLVVICCPILHHLFTLVFTQCITRQSFYKRSFVFVFFSTILFYVICNGPGDNYIY